MSNFNSNNKSYIFTSYVKNMKKKKKTEKRTDVYP